MKLPNELRKEKKVLTSYIGRCRYYLTYIHNLNDRLKEHYFNLYSGLIEKYNSRISEIDLKLSRIKGISISAVVVVVLLLSMFAVYQGDITGNVVFSMVGSNRDNIGMEIMSSQNFTWRPEEGGRLNTISVSGKYIGNGSLRIYLDLENGESKLIYATESSSSFESECGNACYLYDTSQDEYIFRIEMPKGGKLSIDSIEYLVSGLEEFRISPSNVTVNLTDNRFITNSFEIYNSREKNFSVAVYGEGDLTEYLTLYSSYLEFYNNDSSQRIRYDIDVPFNIAPGRYEESIVVRYLPIGEFKGEAPKEIHKVIVNVGESELFAPKGIDYTILIIIGLGVLVIFNIVFFIIKKRGS